MKRLKIVLLVIMIVIGCVLLTGCSYSTNQTKQDIQNTLSIGDKLASKQPTPQDIDYSLERYNLIRRTYWVNGQREKANTLLCGVEKPLGYIALFLDNGSCVGKFIVDGKVSSLNSYLTPDSMYYEKYIGTGEDKYHKIIMDKLKGAGCVLGIALLMVLAIVAIPCRKWINTLINNKVNYVDKKIDDATNYETIKKVEDTCRSMISSYKTDLATYNQYKNSDNEEKQSWAEQAKMRANKTANTYNEYILKNSFVWSGNVPVDIENQLQIIY